MLSSASLKMIFEFVKKYAVNFSNINYTLVASAILIHVLAVVFIALFPAFSLF